MSFCVLFVACLNFEILRFVHVYVKFAPSEYCAIPQYECIVCRYLLSSRSHPPPYLGDQREQNQDITGQNVVFPFNGTPSYNSYMCTTSHNTSTKLPPRHFRRSFLLEDPPPEDENTDLIPTFSRSILQPSNAHCSPVVELPVADGALDGRLRLPLETAQQAALAGPGRRLALPAPLV